MTRLRKLILLVLTLTLGGAGVYYFMLPKINCTKAYSALTKDGVLFITVAFGYKDSRPLRFVGDRYERAAFVDLLLKPCEGSEVVCGFALDPGNPEFFTKKLIWYDKKERFIQIEVLASSIGPDDEWNRKSRIQKWNSDRSRRLFRRAITKSDIVFYNGHSRTGGGPDFFPPRIHASGGVQYKHYKDAQPGFTELLEDLERAKGARQPRLLGLFSCASSHHFLQLLLHAKPKVGVIASQALLYQTDAMENMVAALTAVLKGECEPRFNERLRSKDPTMGSKIYGFF